MYIYIIYEQIMQPQLYKMMLMWITLCLCWIPWKFF